MGAASQLPCWFGGEMFLGGVSVGWWAVEEGVAGLACTYRFCVAIKHHLSYRFGYFWRRRISPHAVVG